ncbi:MAG: N-acetylmuramoyl-L-alanine amidase, partial [Clostridia bacterium]|nr:N-acetylmuramoyl-L-alanine amidase [Clostridia bacterium]
MNKYPGQSRRGAQVFYKKGDDEGKKFAQYVQKRFNEMSYSLREYSALTGDYYITNVSPCPSIIAECGFLSNPDDEALLITDDYRDKLAYAIFRGAIDYLTEPVIG